MIEIWSNRHMKNQFLFEMKSESGLKLVHSWTFENTVTFNYKIDTYFKWKFFITWITQFDVMLYTTSFRTVVYRFLSIRLLIFGLIVEKNDQLPINVMSILLTQWASKFTRDRKNVQNSVLFNNSLPRLRGNELSAKTRIFVHF